MCRSMSGLSCEEEYKVKFVGVRASLREIIKERLELLAVLIHVKICDGLKIA